jgi:hypothetical protein
MDGIAGPLSPASDLTFAGRSTRRVRRGFFSGAFVGALLLTLLAGLAVVRPWSTGSKAPAPTTRPPRVFRRDGLLSLPAAAQGPVSAALGADQGTYRVGVSRGGFVAATPAQRLHSTFTRSGVLVASAGVRVGLSLAAVGLGDSLRPLGAVAPTAKANRVSYQRPGLTEWYASGPLGLEQGFTVTKDAAGSGRGPLTLAMTLSGNAHAQIQRGSHTLTLSRAGAPRLRYTGLTAVDASGRALRSWLALAHGRLLVRVDVRGARYPVRVDPFVQQQSFDGGADSGEAGFGDSVALSADGSTALIGGTGAHTGTGTVWLFTRSDGVWSQQQELSGDEVDGFFGSSVALDAAGTTALVGALGDNSDEGAVFVYTRPDSNPTTKFTLEEKLQGEGAGVGGEFGESVALSSSGETALIGSPEHPGGGAVSVFNLKGGTWQEGWTLTAAGEDYHTTQFGFSVALSEVANTHCGPSANVSERCLTALIGDPFANSEAGGVWVFFTGCNASCPPLWEQMPNTPLVGPAGEGGGQPRGGLGWSVAISADGNSALVGGPGEHSDEGAAWLYTRSASGGASFSEWTFSLQEELKDQLPPGSREFGWGVGLSGNGSEAVIGSPSGAAVYSGGDGAPLVQERLISEPGEPDGEYGEYVALSSDGGTALIGGYAGPGAAGGPRAQVFVDQPAAPAVTSVEPDAGPPAGGTPVTITGANLAGGTVAFDGVPATNTSCTESQCTAESPAGSEWAYVTVTTGSGTNLAGTSPKTNTAADVFVYLPTPTVTSISPHEGATSGGTLVTINGTNFRDSHTPHGVEEVEAKEALFGETAVEATCFTETECVAEAPPGSGTVNVSIRDAGGTSAGSVTDEFTYALGAAAPPTAAIATPAENASYALGEVVDASYSCQAGVGGGVLEPGAAGCAGTVPDGQPIDTSALGPHSFSVTATDTDGQTSTVVTDYTVTSAATTLGISPSPVAFGNVVDGVSAVKTVTVTNRTASPLTVGKLVVEPMTLGGQATSPSDLLYQIFTSNDTCAGELAPGASCTLGLSLKVHLPHNAPLIGPFSITFALKASDAAGGALPLTWSALTGIGVGPLLVSPSPVAFGDVVDGVSAVKTVTLTNQAANPLTVGKLVVQPMIPGAPATSPSDLYYQISTSDDTCAGELAPGASCTLGVSVKVHLPHNEPVMGPFSIAVALKASDAAGAQLPLTAIELTGTGVGPLVLSPSPVAFGDVVDGVSAVKTVTVTNQTASPLTVGRLAVGTASPSDLDYQVLTSDDACVGELAPGASCTLGLSVKVHLPLGQEVLGDFSITVSLAASDAAGGKLPSTPVELTGTGVGPLLLSPSPLAFGDVVDGVSGVETLTVTNQTGSPLTVGQLVVQPVIPGAPATSPSDLDYQISTSDDTCAGQLAPGASCTLGLSLKVHLPLSRELMGDFTITVAFKASDAAGGALPLTPVELTGTGVGPLLLSPSPVAFGDVLDGVSGVETLTVTNQTGSALTVGKLVAQTASPSDLDYQIFTSDDECTVALAPAASCTLGLSVKVRLPDNSPVLGPFTLEASLAAKSATGKLPGTPLPLTGTGVGVGP